MLQVNSANPTVTTASSAFLRAAAGARGWEGQSWDRQIQVPVTTLDALIAHAADIGGKVGENLRNELPILELSRKLATIDATLALEVTAEQLSAGAPDVPRLRELYTRMELRALLKSLGPDAEAAAEAAAEIDVIVAETSDNGGNRIATALAVVSTPAPIMFAITMPTPAHNPILAAGVTARYRMWRSRNASARAAVSRS